RDRRAGLPPALLARPDQPVASLETDRVVYGGLRRPHGRARLGRGNGRRPAGAKPRLGRRKGAALMSRIVMRLEQPVRVCPLGVRFWDTVTRSVVDDGLKVEVYPRAQPHRRVRAGTNRSGVFAFAD